MHTVFLLCYASRKVRTYHLTLYSMSISKKAFTLIELLIVIAIIAILTISFLPTALKAPSRARDAGRQESVLKIQAAVEAYAAQRAGYPATETAAANCFTEITAGLVGIDPLPRDTASLNSCSNAGNENKFYYRSGPGYYIIAAIVENDASSNAIILATKLAAAATLADAKLLDDDTTRAVGETAYYIAVGP